MNAPQVFDIVLGGLFIFAITLMTGLVIGFHVTDIRKRLADLRADLDARTLDDDDEPGTAVITTTPQVIERKRRAGKLDDEDSAIITVKSPQQVRKDQYEQVERDIDRATGTHRP